MNTKKRSEWKHRLTNIDPVDRMANCSTCGRTQVYIQKRVDRPSNVWRCSTAARSYTAKRRAGYDYTLAKKDRCDFCGFIAIDQCQLDVDHIDSDRFNNAESNLQTLCANCHRLKSKMTGGFAGYASRTIEHEAPLNRTNWSWRRTEYAPISPPNGLGGGAQGLTPPNPGPAGGATGQPPGGGPPPMPGDAGAATPPA